LIGEAVSILRIFYAVIDKVRYLPIILNSLQQATGNLPRSEAGKVVTLAVHFII